MSDAKMSMRLWEIKQEGVNPALLNDAPGAKNSWEFPSVFFRHIEPKLAYLHPIRVDWIEGLEWNLQDYDGDDSIRTGAFVCYFYNSQTYENEGHKVLVSRANEPEMKGFLKRLHEGQRAHTLAA